MLKHCSQRLLSITSFGSGYRYTATQSIGATVNQRRLTLCPSRPTAGRRRALGWVYALLHWPCARDRQSHVDTKQGYRRYSSCIAWRAIQVRFLSWCTYNQSMVPDPTRSPFSRLYLAICSRAPIARVLAFDNRHFALFETQSDELVSVHICSVATDGYASKRLK